MKMQAQDLQDAVSAGNGADGEKMPAEVKHRCKHCEVIWIRVATICYEKCKTLDDSLSPKVQAMSCECQLIVSDYSQTEAADYSQTLMRHRRSIRLMYICRFLGLPDEEKEVLSALLEMFRIHRYEHQQVQHLHITVSCFCELVGSLIKDDILKCLPVHIHMLRGEGAERGMEGWRDVMLHKLIQEMCMMMRAGQLEVQHLQAMSVKAFLVYLEWTRTESGEGAYSVMEYLRLRHVLIWAMWKSKIMDSEVGLQMMACLPDEDMLRSMWPQLLEPNTGGNVWEFFPDPEPVFSMGARVERLALRCEQGWDVVRFDLIHPKLLLTLLMPLLEGCPDVWDRVGFANDRRLAEWDAENRASVMSWDEESMSPEMEVLEDKSVLRVRLNTGTKTHLVASTTRPMNRGSGIWSWAIILVEPCDGLVVGFHERKELWMKDTRPMQQKPLFCETSWGWGLRSSGELCHETAAVQALCSSSKPALPLRGIPFCEEEGTVVAVHLNMTDRVCTFSTRSGFDGVFVVMQEAAFSDLPFELFPCVAMYSGCVKIHLLVDDIDTP